MIPSNVLEPSFLPRILKANKNKGISKAIFIIQMGMPVKVLIIIETPVSPPGAILWGFRNIFMEIPMSKHPIMRVITSLSFNDDFIFQHLSETFFISLTKKIEYYVRGA